MRTSWFEIGAMPSLTIGHDVVLLLNALGPTCQGVNGWHSLHWFTAVPCVLSGGVVGWGGWW